VGVFFPTASEDDLPANLLGVFTNSIELNKYAPNTTTLYGKLATYALREQVSVGLEIGPQLAMPKEEDDELADLVDLTLGFQLESFTGD